MSEEANPVKQIVTLSSRSTTALDQAGVDNLEMVLSQDKPILSKLTFQDKASEYDTFN
jgi:hypothetical protein